MKYLNQFIYVLEVVKTSSITIAAENLNLTQPALSKYLKKLESELGIEIFDRSTNPISLTDAGERYIEAARRIIDTDNQLSKQLEQIKRDQNAVIHVGISPSRAPYLLPEIIKSFRDSDTRTRVIIDECSTKELNEKLSHGDLDLIISISDDDTSCFEKTELIEESIMLAVPESMLGDRQLDDKRMALEILHSSPIISGGKGQKMWEMLNDIQTEIGIGDALIECQNVMTAVALVQAGVGVMLVPSYMAKTISHEAESGYAFDTVCFLPLDLTAYPTLASETNRTVCLFYRKEQFLSRSEKRFIRCAVEAAKVNKATIATGATTVERGDDNVR